MAGTTLGTAYVQIVPSAQGIKGSLTSLMDGESKAAGTSAGMNIGAFAKKALVATGIGASVGATIKASLGEGAKLQQSYLGGLDTLYGEAADAARAYAREAASAGISMNDYSEQAVSFGAALKSAYGGDVKKAAEAANTAIMDMADNSAKMGTDIESVQMAYQGFAKGQYQLLDNLKLGYGGTKEEMQRLLEDAEKLSGQDYSIDNLGDVYDAIHVIQGDLGLTGVAAAEASETFSGSFGAMKAAADNLLGSIALGEGVSEAMSTLITSATTFFFGNFIPMLGTMIQSLPAAIMTFVRQGVPILLSNILSLVTQFANQLTSLANGMTGKKVTQWANGTAPKLVAAAGNLLGRFASAMIANLPRIASALGRIGLAIVKGLGSALWGKVTQAAKGIYDRFMAPINKMKDKVKGVIDKIKGWFPFNLGKILKLQLPKITLNKKTASILGKSITYPTGFSIAWHAKGGIYTRPTLLTGADGVVHGIGDVRGGEAILPLNELWKHLDSAGGTTINVYANAGMSVTDLADEVQRRIIQMQKRRQYAWR